MPLLEEERKFSRYSISCDEDNSLFTNSLALSKGWFSKKRILKAFRSALIASGEKLALFKPTKFSP
jgi:hypothetical protein